MNQQEEEIYTKGYKGVKSCISEQAPDNFKISYVPAVKFDKGPTQIKHWLLPQNAGLYNKTEVQDAEGLNTSISCDFPKFCHIPRIAVQKHFKAGEKFHVNYTKSHKTPFDLSSSYMIHKNEKPKDIIRPYLTPSWKTQEDWRGISDYGSATHQYAKAYRRYVEWTKGKKLPPDTPLVVGEQQQQSQKKKKMNNNNNRKSSSTSTSTSTNSGAASATIASEQKKKNKKNKNKKKVTTSSEQQQQQIEIEIEAPPGSPIVDHYDDDDHSLKKHTTPAMNSKSMISHDWPKSYRTKYVSTIYRNKMTDKGTYVKHWETDEKTGKPTWSTPRGLSKCPVDAVQSIEMPVAFRIKNLPIRMKRGGNLPEIVKWWEMSDDSFVRSETPQFYNKELIYDEPNITSAIIPGREGKMALLPTSEQRSKMGKGGDNSIMNKHSFNSGKNHRKQNRVLNSWEKNEIAAVRDLM